jgi:hypothetical protein
MKRAYGPDQNWTAVGSVRPGLDVHFDPEDRHPLVESARQPPVSPRGPSMRRYLRSPHPPPPSHRCPIWPPGPPRAQRPHQLGLCRLGRDRRVNDEERLTAGRVELRGRHRATPGVAVMASASRRTTDGGAAAAFSLATMSGPLHPGPNLRPKDRHRRTRLNGRTAGFSPAAVAARHPPLCRWPDPWWLSSLAR